MTLLAPLLSQTTSGGDFASLNMAQPFPSPVLTKSRSVPMLNGVQMLQSYSVGHSMRQISFPSLGVTAKRPVAVKNRICCFPSTLIRVGVAYAALSSPDFHTSLPVVLSKAATPAPL